MTIMKTEDLEGSALDWAVAKAEKIRVVIPEIWKECKPPLLAKIAAAKAFPYGPPSWEPSKDWSQGGPIIEAQKIDLEYFNHVEDWLAIHPRHYEGPPYASAHGETALVAAMRCYVKSKLGEEVDIPKRIADCFKEQP